MSAPQVSTAFIDLATYGELESYLYSRPFVKEYQSTIKQRLSNTTLIVILIIIFLIYIKG
jgi:hypothetical protein